eukprot:gene28247-34112_t
MEFEHTVQQLREEVAVLQAKLQQAEEKILQLEEENDLLALENDLLRTKVNTQQLDKESKDSTVGHESVKQEPLEMIAAGNNDYAKRATHTLANACGGKNMICVAYFLSPDCEELPDMIVCGGVDGVITGYDLQMGVKMFSVRASAPLLCMASAGANVACGTMDGSLAVLHFADLSATTPLVTTYTHHSKYVVCVSMTQDAKTLITASYDKYVHIYKLNSMGAYEKQQSVLFETTPESALVYVPSHTPSPAEHTPVLIVGLRDVPYLVYVNTHTLEKASVSLNVNTWDTHVSFTPLYLALSPCQKYICVCTDKNLHIVYKLHTNHRVCVLGAHTSGDYSKPVCVWHHTSKYIYCNSEGDSAVYVYDLCTQRVSLKLHGHGNVVRGLAAHPFKASLASASYDKSVIVWGE